MNPSISEKYTAFLRSQEMLDASRVLRYPLDILDLIKSTDILVTTVSEYEEFRRVTGETRPYIPIRDGRAYYDLERDLYLIVYNERAVIRRRRFTLSHEFAHIVLGHLDDEITEIDRGGLTPELYRQYEDEADTFAGNILVPPIIVEELGVGQTTSAKSISDDFYVSMPAATNHRLPDYLYWREYLPVSDSEKNILRRYRERCRHKRCSECESVFIDSGYEFCIYCGSRLNFSLREGDVMIYPGKETNSFNSLTICPKCDNTEIGNDNFCMICGASVKNSCAEVVSYIGDFPNTIKQVSPSCGKINLPGNARFCPNCGNLTSFFEDNYLRPWNDPSVTAEIEVANNASDDELPF